MASFREAHLRWARHYLDVLHRLAVLYQQGGDNARCSIEQFDSEWRQIRARQAWAAAHAEAYQPAAELCVAYGTSGSSGTGAPLRDLRQSPLERIRWLEAGLGAARSLGDRRAEAALLYDLGLTCSEWYGPETSLEYGERARVIFRDLGDDHNESAALNLLGHLHNRRGDLQRCIEFHEQALALAQKIGNTRDEAYTRSCLGAAYRALGDHNRAVESDLQALTLMRDLGDKRETAKTLIKLGLHSRDLGDIDRAVEFFGQASTILDEDADLERTGFGSTLSELGLAYLSIGDRRGLTYLEKNLAAAQGAGNRYGEGCALVSLGLGYASVQEGGRALEAYTQAVTALNEAGPRVLEGIAYRYLGDVHARRGDAEQALQAYERATAILYEVGSVSQQAQAHWLISRQLERLGLRSQAIVHGEAALKLFAQTDENMAVKVRKLLSEWGRIVPEIARSGIPR